MTLGNEAAATEGPVGGGSEDCHAWLADKSEHTLTPAQSQAPTLAAPIRARDHQFRVAGDWALATEGLQWIVQRRYRIAGKAAWRLLSFVRSTRDVLERCLREKGADSSSIQALVAGLPETFEQWLAEEGRS